MIEAVIGGFGMALILVMLVAVIWLRAKDALDRWAYNLMGEPNRQLHESQLTLESIQRGQERLQREINTVSGTLRDLRSRPSSHA